MTSGTVEAEQAKVRNLFAYAQELEEKLDAPFDASPLLVPLALRRVLGSYEILARWVEDKVGQDAFRACSGTGCSLRGLRPTSATRFRRSALRGVSSGEGKGDGA